LVDTIVAITLGAFKMTSPDGYGCSWWKTV